MGAAGEQESGPDRDAIQLHLATVMMKRVPCASITESGVSTCMPQLDASPGTGSQRVLVIRPVTTAIDPRSTLATNEPF